MKTFSLLAQLRQSTTENVSVARGYRVAAWAIALLAVVFLAAAPQLLAQAQNTGSIFGTVVDPTGAVISGATVTLTNTSNGAERVVTSNKNGEYSLQDIAVGSYVMSVTAEGFETYVAEDLQVDADSNSKIPVKLTIGAKGETVTVEEGGTTVDARSATLGSLIDNKMVEDIPIDGRNVVAMAGLLPGVSEVNAPTQATNDTAGPTYSAGGGRNTQNLMLFDGLMWNNLFFNSGVNYPSPNALQEISILLNNYKAQYGRNAGSVFNVITRSGTNTIHGAVWDYFHNQYFDAQDYLNPLPTLKAPEDNINQFGFTVGGPIKRDKIFFFGALQEILSHLQNVGYAVNSQGAAERGFASNADYYTNRSQVLAGNTNAYTRACTSPGPFAGMMCANFAQDIVTNNNGNYVLGSFANPMDITPSGNGASPAVAVNQIQTAWTDAGNSGQSPCISELQNQANVWAGNNNFVVNYTPPGSNTPQQLSTTKSSTTETYLPFAEIPVNCLNPVTAAMLAKYVPLPSVTHNGRVSSVSYAAQPKHDTNVLARVDWMVNSRHTIDMRYNLISGYDRTAPGVNSASTGVANYEIDYDTVTSNFGNIGDTWVITPNIVNVIRAGYKRYENITTPTDGSTWNTFNPGGPEGYFSEPGVPVLPAISLGSSNYGFGAAGAGGGVSNQAWSDHVNEDIEIMEQLSWTRGKHNFQFGGNFLRLQYNNNQDYPGQMSFGTSFTNLAIGDYALGTLGNVRANSPLQQGGVQHNIFSYAQDDWRATSRLTVNYGVRYELPFQWYQPSGYSSTFIPGHQSTVFPGAIGGLAFPGDSGVLSSLVPTDFNGLVPRIGFAYDLKGDASFLIRGGFGMFFDAVNANVIGVGEPFYYQYYTLYPVGGASDPLLLTAGTTARETLPSGYNKANPLFQAPYSLFFPDRNFRTPYVMAYNLGFQYKVPHGGTLEANYVGRFARKLTVAYDQNPAIAECSGGYYNANPNVYAPSTCPFINGAAGGAANSSAGSTQQRLRYTQFNYGGAGLVDFASIGMSSYNALQVQYHQRGGKKLTLQASYTYSKSIDIQSNGRISAGQTSSVPNPFNVNTERGLSDNDARHMFALGWVYSLPILHGGTTVERNILNNWKFSGSYQARTGNPFTVYINQDAALDGEGSQRAELVPGMNPVLPSNRHRAQKVNEWFNVDAFTYPMTGTFSKVHRNSFTGPAYINTNFALGRDFPMNHLRTGMRLNFRAEALNVFNTPNLLNFSGTNATFSCSHSTISNTAVGPAPCIQSNATTNYTIAQGGYFGQVLATYGTNGSTQSNGRKMQFALTLYY
jgi:hypothetical protein